MKKKYQVFVSSTYEDLKTERQYAVEAILKAGHIPAGMELFAAGSESQLQVIKDWIAESDIFLLILGGRYGSIEPTSGLSYIELEYNYAKEIGKPYFAIVIGEKFLDEKVSIEKRKVIELENQNKLRDFRKKVLGNLSAFFENCPQIQTEILHSINVIEKKNNLGGWIREIQKNPTHEEEKLSLNKKITELNDTIIDCKNQITTLNNNRIDLIGDKLFKEIDLDLTQSRIKVPAGYYNRPYEQVYALIDLYRHYRDSLDKGFTNDLKSDPDTMFFINNVIPLLKQRGLVDTREAKIGWKTYKNTRFGSRFLAIDSIRNFIPL